MSTSTASDSGSSQQSIAILDDYAEIAATHFSHIPNLKIDNYSSTLNPKKDADLQALIERLKPYPIISCMRERTPFPSTLLTQLPNLRLLLTTGIRNASIDLATCKAQSITVAGTTGARPSRYDSDGNPLHWHEGPKEDAQTQTQGPSLPPPPGYDSTTQHGWSLLLSLTSRIPTDTQRLLETSGSWQSGFSIPLGGKTLGVLGLGKLGTSFARIARFAFGMNVVAWSENLTQDKADAAAQKAGLESGVFTVVGSKEELFRRADVLSIHYVLSDRSRGIVGARELGLMKKSAVLVNTARGPLIDEDALFEVLDKGGIRGAALDVWWEEPLPGDSRWRSTKWGQDGRSELVLSPHMGYVNEGTMNSWYREQAADVEKWLQGEEVGVRLA